MSTSSQYFPRSPQCEFLEIDEDELDTSSLNARVIKSPTREILLSGRPSWTKSASNSTLDAGTLLSDLSQLAPSAVKDFIPKDHAERSFPFRLINDIDYHGEMRGFIAMSYCWKKEVQETPRTVVTPLGDLPFGWTKEVEQFPLPTSAAIFQAVLRERRIGEGLWFDQVCINQKDEVEKAMTVGSMDVIYANARTVVVALDDVEATPEEEQFLRYYIEQYDYATVPSNQQPNLGLSPPFMHQCAALKSFLERIITSTWFERAWCAHEMRTGQSHVFLVPCYVHYEDEVQTVIRFTSIFFLHMLSLAGELQTIEPTLYARIQPLLDFFSRRVTTKEEAALAALRPDTPQSPKAEPTSLVPLIAEIFLRKAGGNPRLPEYQRRLDANREKMCIALNASGLPLALTPSNSFSRPSVEDECFRSLLLVGLAARDYVALCTTGPPLQLHDGSVSWLCRPTTLDVNAVRPPPRNYRRKATPITQASDGRAEYVQLDLVFLELPHRSQPNPHFRTHTVRARLYIDLCIQYQVPGPGLWNFWQTPNHSRAISLRNIFIQTLACVFDCGSQWLIDLSSNLQLPQTSTIDPDTIEMLLNPHLLVQNYIAFPEGRAALSLLVQFISTLIASGIPWASGSTERTHGPLIISLPTSPVSSPYNSISRSSSSNSTNNSSSNNNKALIFAPFEHSKTLLIAVPDAVKDAEFESLARGWILTSMNPYTGATKQGVSWTLQSKGVVFGGEGFKRGLEGRREADVRNHRVYGPSSVR
ncbi:Nn.00g045240.m01.CDS01 [Neocucurbitaria sp. VM-36]